ncbi:hypothetical protein GYMLUDRAFT_1002785 [Collybiopsis luxurians FD-317 M1]|nr:hypothetical protein GYMLUDRAFT_1002785 [Collybiopsis luxurians FD-317 M1]
MSSMQLKTYSLSGGIELSYTDVGAPPNSDDYTTVLIIHGSIFNAYQLHKVHSYAHALNLRTVLLHKRDYAGSTPYTPTELQEIKQGSRIFWERSSAQLAEFLGLFIEQEKIPKLKDYPRSGGIAIVGWSMGNVPVLSFLATANDPPVPTGLSKLLEGYIGKCVLYEPPYLALGYPLPSDNPNYSPWLDTDSSPEEILEIFLKWIGLYFDHPCYDPANQSWPSSATIYDFDGARPKGYETSSISSWTDEEIAKGIERNAVATEMLMFKPEMQDTIRALGDQALFDPKNFQNCFPKVDIAYIGGTRSAWSCAWTEFQVKKRFQSKEGRPMRFLDMDGWNHFVIEKHGDDNQAHWDRPQQFMQVVAECIRPTSCLSKLGI